MRTALILLCAGFSISLFAQATFAPIGAQWTYTQHHVGGPDTNLFVIECVGDTVIQGRSCSRLEYSEGWNGCMPFFHELARQGDSILAWQPYESNFMTLYVLDQAPGFTWESVIDYPFGKDTMRWTVLDTGHVVIGGATLFTQSVSATVSGPYGTVPLTSGTITERLGDMGYLFPWISGACDMEMNGPLRCYEDPDITWINPQFPQCELGDPVPAAVRFDDPLGTWFVADTRPEGSMQDPSFAATQTMRYFFSGTMAFGGETWQRLQAQPTWDGSPFATYMGAARQSGPLVFFLDTLFTVDTLYNFNLQVGDSVRYPDFGAPSPYLTLEAIDTVMIQDYPHRRYHFSEYPQTLEDVFTDTWIEGIGSIHGPLAPRRPSTLGYHSLPDSTRTTCYWHAQDLLWQHPGYGACVTNILLGIDAATRPVGMTITPTLIARGASVQVTVGPAVKSAGRLEIRDITGRLLHTRPITAATMEVAMETPGIILVTAVTHDGSRITRRVVVR